MKARGPYGWFGRYVFTDVDEKVVSKSPYDESKNAKQKGSGLTNLTNLPNSTIIKFARTKEETKEATKRETMARKPRLEFAGALYHVIARGNNREDIFRESEDYLKYLALLEKYQGRTLFHLYAFVLMPNHIHLLVETEDTPLSKMMQCLQQSYTQYFNRKYHRTGHVFQGRYKAILCQEDPYLLQLTRYIHLNPVRSKIVDSPSKYRWSSHSVYLGKKDMNFVEADKVLSMFSPSKRRAKELYQEFVLQKGERDHSREFYEILDQCFLGEKEFVEEVAKRVNITKEVTKKSSLDELVKLVFGLTQISGESIKGLSKERGVTNARDLFTYVAIRQMGYSSTEVARFLKKDSSAITHTLNRMRERLAKDKDLIGELDKIKSLL